VAINDVLPLKATRGDDIANLKTFYGLATPTAVLTRWASYHQTELSWQNNFDIA